MRKKKMELDIINPNCAGIDIGSKSHYVAVGQALEDVKEFGVYAGLLMEVATTGPITEIDVADLPPGLYVVHLNNQSQHGQQFIKQ